MSRDLINPTTVALALLLIVLVVAAASRLWVAIATSVAAMLVFNFFFLPPVGTFTIAAPQNWVALLAFLVVSVVASHLSSVARARASDALSRRDELSRLFDLSRDILLTDETDDALAAVARTVARRFNLDYAAICRPQLRHMPGGEPRTPPDAAKVSLEWQVAQGGTAQITLDPAELTRVFRSAAAALEYDADTGSYGAHALVVAGYRVTILPLRFGSRVVGLLAVAGGELAAAARDAVGGLVAIAMERAQFLAERKAGELAGQAAELKSALLASIAHDLRTPLTALGVAATNLQSGQLPDAERREQTELVLAEVRRLSRLFDNILEMARIDVGGVAAAERWVPLSEIVQAACGQVAHTTAQHRLEVELPSDALVRIDPRLTASALSHLIENAAQHSPAGSVITIAAHAANGEAAISVRDRGPGIAPADLPRLFERFYRGARSTQRSTGAGMGLSIARGLLAAEKGKIWAENCPDGGARFTIAVPAGRRDLGLPV